VQLATFRFSMAADLSPRPKTAGDPSDWSHLRRPVEHSDSDVIGRPGEYLPESFIFFHVDGCTTTFTWHDLKEWWLK
jgi:hypothetical protein